MAKAINAAADSFGAHWVHIVGHSTGGLWGRAALVNDLSNLGIHVYSLTTVDSPHYGSYNADMRQLVWEYYHGNPQNLSISLTERLLEKTVYTPAIPGLTTKAMLIFKAKNENLLPNTITADGRVSKVFYNATASDANADHSCENGSQPCDRHNLPTISIYDSFNRYPDESEGYEAPDPDFNKNFVMRRATWINLGEFMYRGMFQYSAATVKPRTILLAFAPPATVYEIKSVPSPTLHLNDFNVTVESAYHPKFTRLGTTNSYNHTMMDSSDMGLAVLQAIQAQQQYYK